MFDLIRISPRGRRSRPFQRGATECQAWNKRIYLTATVWVRLRRAEVYGLWSMVHGLRSMVHGLS